MAPPTALDLAAIVVIIVVCSAAGAAIACTLIALTNLAHRRRR